MLRLQPSRPPLRVTGLLYQVFLTKSSFFLFLFPKIYDILDAINLCIGSDAVETKELEEITGVVSGVIFENEENGYKVIELDADDQLIIAVGYLQGVSEGESVRLRGKWTTHATYGEQFQVELFEKELPTSIEAVERYLASGIIKGIRESTAKKIVALFGENALAVIEHEPMKLTKIKGISASKAAAMQESFLEQVGASTLVIFLQNYDVSVKMAAKIYHRFGSGAVEKIKANPYILSDEIEGIGFQTADRIAMRMGVPADAHERLRAGVLYTQRYQTQFGHTFLPRHLLMKAAAKLLHASTEAVASAIDALLIENRLVSEVKGEQERIYDTIHFWAEKYVAKKLLQLNQLTFEIEPDALEKEISAAETLQNIQLAQLQREAVRSAMQNGVLVITGGPGTGKTTIINTIISLMRSSGYTVSLTAPTGRAAKRMTQVCNMEAKTIHRLLEAGFGDDDDGLQFQINEESPIDSDVVIVDEMSMVDILLMSNLLRAIRYGTRLILVGDQDQLPSVGPGNVLKDIIESGSIKVIALTEIFRQAQTSMIVVNAHRINRGKYPICNQKGRDFFLARLPDAAAGAAYILSLCSERLPKAYGFSPFDIQVLSPAKKGVAGVWNLNAQLQQVLNPPDPGKEEVTSGFVTFREGDKVMQTKNNYDLPWKTIAEQEEGRGVFNGDVGIIEKIHPPLRTLSVVFDNRRVTYAFKDLEELDLAYCMTVHKSQGSEFPVVVIPLYDAPYMLINRNLFYTAVTRAKSLVVLVGREEIMRRMVDNDREMLRYSGLDEKLQKGGWEDDVVF